ncbi:MAG TPA: hypothetical protein VJ276_21760 [Thermoanaerobaculia bacterium]|nr:hypothetical protein [Thermoanaerobaculia bacterium]
MRRLFVKANPAVSDANPARHHIFLRRDDGSEQQILFAGFSYYGEVAGLRAAPADDFVELLPDTDPPNENWPAALSQPASNAVRMTYGQWMRFLSDHNVNQSRLFCYPEVLCARYPIHRYRQGHPDPAKRNKYDLNIPNEVYLRALTRYIELARRKGIVVQISFASWQALRNRANTDDWNANPFNSETNINLFIKASDGLSTFCNLNGHPNVLAAEKRYIEAIVNRTKPFWNVMYELFNEPIPGMTGVVDWHRQVATWVHDLLRDPSTGERSHLITFNAPATLLDPALAGGSLLAKLLLDDAGRRLAVPLVDAYHFHGDQWGGVSGTKVCANRPGVPSSPPTIRTATRNAVNGFYDRFIDAGHRLQVAGSRVAIVCDADAHSLAQDNPRVYAAAAFGLSLSYVHRWMNCYLQQGKLRSQAEGLRDVVHPRFSPPPDTGPSPIADVPALPIDEE